MTFMLHVAYVWFWVRNEIKMCVLVAFSLCISMTRPYWQYVPTETCRHTLIYIRAQNCIYSNNNLTNKLTESVFWYNENFKCLLSFSSEYFIFYLLSKNVKIEAYKSIILSVILYGWRNMVSHPERRTYTEDVWSRSTEVNIWAQEGGSTS
jgi:hypothetical protein